MLISDQYQFLFVHVSKAAGSSIYRTLAPHANPKDASKWNKLLSKTGLRNNYQTRYFPQHAVITEAIQSIPPERFDELFKFAFVRNPWDWVVSMYSFLRQNNTHRHNDMIKRMSFAEYVDYEIKRGQRFQHSFVCDGNGDVRVDYIGRFENLEADFKQVCARIGLELSLPHVNQSKHKDFREYYDASLRDKIAQHWRKDIELFEYQFD